MKNPEKQPVTNGWLIYRIEDGDLVPFGLCQTEERANADVAALNDGWLVKRVMFIGWGQVAPGVFSQNGRPPLKVVE